MNKIAIVYFVMVLLVLAGCSHSAKVLEFTNEDIDDFCKNLDVNNADIQKSVINDVFIYPSIKYFDGDIYDGVYKIYVGGFSFMEGRRIQVKNVEIKEIDFICSVNQSMNIDEFLERDGVYFGAVFISTKVDLLRAYELSKKGIPLSVTVTAECDGELITFTYDFNVIIKRFAVPRV